MNLMIEYSLRATLVFTLALAVTRMLRRQPAAFRHVIWICAFIIAAATPVFLQFGPRIQIERPAPLATLQAAAGSASVNSDSVDHMSLQPSRAQPSQVAPRFRTIPFLEIVWFAGFMLAGTRVWNARRRACALLKNAVVLENLSGAESVRIAETDAVATAMTLGVFRPWILLPREHRRWEPELLRAVLLHELAHVRRRDCLVQWLPNVVCAVHWFNPLVWLARSEMLCESERACDDAVIRSGVSGRAFARDLVEIAQSIHSKGESLMSTAVTTKLERRIARLLDPAANRVPLTAGRAVFGAVIALALLVPIAGVRAEQTLKGPTVISPPQVTVEPRVTPQPVVTAPRKAPRGVLQVAQAQVTQAAPSPQSSPTGSLSGVVSDPTGAVVAGATVRVQLSPSPGGVTTVGGGRGGAPASYSTVTAPTGQWSLSSLPAGTYTLEVQVPGFRSFNKTFTVSPGLNTRADAHLMLGRSTESVTVTAERPTASLGPAPLPAAQASSQPIRVSAGVQPPKLIRHVTPVFPQSARDQGIQGSVTFEAVIGKAGFIDNTQLATSYAPPDLVQAALDAIKQWQYSPALLNGEPVDVLTEITVNFTLQ
jgi:TonB family protein